MKKQKILVTGSEGFIGSHLTEKLLDKGYKVRAMVLYNSFNNWGWLESFDKKKRKNLEVVLGDIRDDKIVEKSFNGVNYVINLAALIGIPYSYTAVKSYLDTNVIGLMNILNNAKKKKIKQVIHISTSEVYGTPNRVPIDEKFPLNAQSPYAASKIAADQLALSFYRSFGIPVSIIRPFNTFGPRQSARAVIPTIIAQAIKKNNIEIGSINPKRDFLYVEDTVNGIISAIGNKKSVGEIINLGSGQSISIKNLIKKIGFLLDKKLAIREKALRKRPKKSEVDWLLSSTKKAKKILNWLPKNSGNKYLDNGLKKTIEWFRIKENLNKYKEKDFNY